MRTWLIFGSCVARDAIECLRPRGHSLVSQISRTSLASAFAPLQDGTLNQEQYIQKLSSPFQQRMVRQDISKNAASLIRAKNNESVLIDLIDERFDIAMVAGTRVSISAELGRTGFKVSSFAEGDRIASGSRRHLDFASEGIEVFAALLEDSGLASQTYLIRTYWATHDDRGERLDGWGRLTCSQANRTLEALYEMLESAMPWLNFIDPPTELTTASSQHKWGRAPFHYIDAFNDFCAGALPASRQEVATCE